MSVLRLTRHEIMTIKQLHVTAASQNILRDISFNLKQGEIVAVVGESGCGKTTLLKAIANLLAPNLQIKADAIVINAQDVREFSKRQWRSIRGNQIAMIFQNPYFFFSPVKKIKAHFIQAIRNHQNFTKEQAIEKSRKILQTLNFSEADARRVLDSYAFELSGGMLQRVSIALAIVLQPSILLADEPTSALDVITQQQILEELLQLRKVSNTSIIMITHDLGCAAYIADRIIVMHEGKIIESAPTATLLSNPQETYTKKLLLATPRWLGDDTVYAK